MKLKDTILCSNKVEDKDEHKIEYPNDISSKLKPKLNLIASVSGYSFATKRIVKNSSL